MKNLFLSSILTISFISQIPATETLTECDIQEIYNTYVKSMILDDTQHYVPFPKPKKDTHWTWEGRDLGRVIAVLEFERFIIEHKISSKKGLAINGLDPEWHYLPHKRITQINYIENPTKYDLHILDLSEKDFDFVIVNQTFEHVYDPIRCLKNIFKHIKPNGILYFNVPGNTIPHDTPFHYYNGFTAVGVGAMVKAAGFKILKIGQWSNREYLKKMHEVNTWPDYRDLNEPGRNDPSYCPVIVWIFAVKQATI